MKILVSGIVILTLILVSPFQFEAGAGTGSYRSLEENLAGGKTGHVNLPVHRDITLGNGMNVCVAEMHDVPMVTIMLLLPAGSVFDPEGKEGLANLTAMLIDKGCGDMSAEDISDKVAGVGGELEVDISRDYVMVEGDFLKEDFSMALQLTSAVVMKPAFIPGEVEKQRGIVLAEIESVKERPYSLANRYFRKFLLEGHPYANPLSGYAGSVAAIERDDIEFFHSTHYLPGGSVLAVVGDVDTEDILDEVRQVFDGWEKGVGVQTEIDTVRVIEEIGGMRDVMVIDKPDLTQSQIRIGNIAVGIKTPDYFPLLVANSILGGGFTSRLMDEIRVERGLSYGASSYLSQYGWGGYFGVYTFTRNETLRETIDVALAELDRIIKVEVDEEELIKTKRYISGLFPFDVETSRDVARWLTRISFYDLESDFVEKYTGRVAGVSSKNVQRVAGRYFHSENCRILILTDYQKTSDQLKGLGRVEVIGIDELE